MTITDFKNLNLSFSNLNKLLDIDEEKIYLNIGNKTICIHYLK
jgi:hypothetical protein